MSPHRPAYTYSLLAPTHSQKSCRICINLGMTGQKWGGHVHASPPRGDATECSVGNEVKVQLYAVLCYLTQ